MESQTPHLDTLPFNTHTTALYSVNSVDVAGIDMQAAAALYVHLRTSTHASFVTMLARCEVVNDLKRKKDDRFNWFRRDEMIQKQESGLVTGGKCDVDSLIRLIRLHSFYFILFRKMASP